MFQEADLCYSKQNVAGNPKMGSKQSVVVTTQQWFFQKTIFGTKTHQNFWIFCWFLNFYVTYKCITCNARLTHTVLGYGKVPIFSNIWCFKKKVGRERKLQILEVLQSNFSELVLVMHLYCHKDWRINRRSNFSWYLVFQKNKSSTWTKITVLSGMDLYY